jgi:hypothetical protein
MAPPHVFPTEAQVGSAPSNVNLLLDGRFAALHCRVAINDGLAVIQNRRRAEGPPHRREGR